LYIIGAMRVIIKLAAGIILLISLVGCESLSEVLSDLLYSPLQQRVEHKSPAVAFDGTHFLVVWGAGDIFARRIGNYSAFLTPIFTLIEDDTIQGQPAVVTLDTMFLVVWVDHRIRKGGIFKRLLPATGIPSTEPGTPLVREGSCSHLYLARGNSRSLLYWEKPGRYENGVKIAIVGPEGNLVTSPQRIGWIQHYAHPPIAASDDRYAVLIDNEVVFVDTAGQCINSTVLPISYYAPVASIAFGDDVWVVATEEHVDLNYDIAAYILTYDGELARSRIWVTRSSAYDVSPVVVFGENKFLILWRRDTQICARRITADGDLLDYVDKVITERESQPRKMVATYGDNCFLVVWQEYTEDAGYQIYGCRVSLDGTLLSPGVFCISK